MWYNFNGKLYSSNVLEVTLDNRAMNYGDGIFETLKYANGRINFWEDHYFRLMASMRIVRMEIPMHFSPEFIDAEIRKTLEANGLEKSAARVKLLVSRKAGGYYKAKTNDIDYLITTIPIENTRFVLNSKGLEIELFRDHYKPEGLLSNLKSTSSQIYTLASIFCSENGFDEAVLMNPNKEVVETISSNLFMLTPNGVLKSPPLQSGCIKGVVRKQILTLAKKLGLEVKEETFSPFELQKAEELFLTNSIKGISWVGKYRKKTYSNDLSQKLTDKLNIHAALS